jgi:hypothetical protein
VVASVPKSHLDMAQNNSYNAAQAARDRSALKAQIARDRAALRNGQNSRRPAPRPKAAPQRGNAQRRAGPQRKSRLSFNSFSPSIMPLAFSVGRCTRLQGLSRGDFFSDTTSGSTYKLGIWNGVPGHYVGRVFNVDTAASPMTASTEKLWSMQSAGFALAQVGAGGTATAPDHAMCAKFSLRIRNISKAIDVGGVVRVLNMSAGASANFTTDIDELVQLIRYVEAHPRTVTFGASELRSTQQFDTHPVDQSLYHTFREPTHGLSEWDEAVTNPAMSTIVMVIPTFANNQYEVTANGHYYARYSVTGPLANMASNPPTADQSLLNRARDEAEALGSRGYKAASRIERHAEPYVGASIGRAVGGMIEGAALG